MSKDNENIDRLFREGLSDFTEQPPSFIWNSIEDEIRARKKRKAVLIFWQGISAAAVITIAFILTILYKNDNINTVATNGSIINTTEKSNDELKSNLSANSKSTHTNTISSFDLNKNSNSLSNTISENNKQIRETLNQSSDNHNTQIHTKEYRIENELAKIDSKEHSIINTTQKSNEEIKSNLSANSKSTHLNTISSFDLNKNSNLRSNTISENNKLIRETLNQSSDNHNTQIHIKEYRIENELAKLDSKEPSMENNYDLDLKNLDIKDHKKPKQIYLSPFINHLAINEKPDKKGNLLSVSGSISPTYAYRTASDSKSANQESGITSISGGLNINIKASKRFQIETGVLYAQLGQKFSNSSYSPKRSIAASANPENRSKHDNPEPSSYFKNSLGNISVSTNNAELTTIRKASNKRPRPQLNSNTSIKSSNDINVQQELDYFEVPINLKYYVLDKKYKILLTSGLSSNFLIGNAAYSLKNGSKNFIGNIEGLKKVSYSASFGFGIKTPLSKSFDLNIEPKFKYFFNSITSSNQHNFKPYSFGVFSGVSYNF